MIQDFYCLPAKYGEAGWDGYDALPISPESFSCAYECLTSCSRRLPRAEITVDPQGDVCFTWRKSRNDRLEMTFSRNRTCYALLVTRGVRTLQMVSDRESLAREALRVLDWKGA